MFKILEGNFYLSIPSFHVFHFVSQIFIVYRALELVSFYFTEIETVLYSAMPMLQRL